MRETPKLQLCLSHVDLVPILLFGIPGSARRYDLSVQPRDKSQGEARSLVESIVAAIPGVRHYRSIGMFEYGHPPGVLHMRVEGGDQAHTVRLSLPGRYKRTDTAALVLLLAFRIADCLKWQVYDRQAGHCYERTALDDVLRSQRKFGQTADEILARRASGDAPFCGVFSYYFLRPGPAVIVLALLLTAGAPGFLIYALSLPLRAFVWLAMGAGLLAFVTSALVSSLKHARRTG